MHAKSKTIMGSFVSKHLSGFSDVLLKVLDVGALDVGSAGNYRQMFSKWDYVGADVASGSNVDVVLDDPYRWGFPDESFDVVVSGQAFEHIEFPWLTVKEIARVLKVGGLCCIIAPASGEVHRHPVDCWRIYPDGFAALAKWANLETISVSASWDNRWSDCCLIATRKE